MQAVALSSREDMKTIKTSPSQTLYDVAVQWYGTTEAVGELMRNNPALENDPGELVKLGIDYLQERSFYPDAALLPGQAIQIDESSFLLKQTVVQQLRNKEISTYDYGTND